MITTVLMRFLLVVGICQFIHVTEATSSCAKVFINELDADQYSTDHSSFVELLGPPNSLLNGLFVNFFAGTSDSSYNSVNLTGYTTDSNGYFILGLPAVQPDYNLTKDLQNSACAVALYCNPVTTALSSQGLVDAVIYNNGKKQDSVADGLMKVLLPGQAVVHETPSTSGQEYSVSRCGCNNLLLDACFNAVMPTVRAANNCSAPPTPSMCANVSINELDADQPGTDNASFVELRGEPNVNLGGLLINFFQGSLNKSYMNINLTGYNTDQNGFIIIGMRAVQPNVLLPASMQHSACAVALYCNPASTALSNQGLVDAVVYNNQKKPDSVAAGLISVLLPGQQVVEEVIPSNQDMSVSRCYCSTKLKDACFTSTSPTIRASNVCPTTTIPPTTTTYPYTVLPLCNVATTSIVINEVNADTGPFADFVELYDGGKGYTSLKGLVLMFFKPGSSTAYVRKALPVAATNAQGYYLIGQAAIHPDLILQYTQELVTGVGAVALYCTPNSNSLSSNGLVDAVVYNTGNWSLNAQAQPLLDALLPGQSLRVEQSSPDTSTARCPPTCLNKLNSTCFQGASPSPRNANVCPYNHCTDVLGQNTFTSQGILASSLCTHGVCQNTPSGAQCICSFGYFGNFCNQMIPQLTQIVTRCALYSTPSIVNGNIPLSCPSGTYCMPSNHNCFFQYCDYPIGWCLAAH